MDIIDLQAVSKKYPIYERPGDRLRELLTLNRRSYHQEHWAVRDLTLGIRSGETFCVIGENGSGKSTLLQLIGGILKPTSGQVRVHGRITALLELGSGFNPEYTGRENVHLNGAILGFAAGEVERKLGQILEFAEIGDFIDQPVRTYSSGMLVRLAFAVAVHLDPDILIVDEALAVGDICFRQRCMRKIHEMRSRGVTIVYVTHDVSDVKAIGHRTLWLDRGRAAALGDSAEVVQKYLAAMIAKDARRLRSGQERVSGPAAEYFEPAEIVTSIDLPLPPEVNGSAFVRVTRRRGFDLGTVSVSCLLVPGAAARFGFGAVAPRPLLAVDDTITLGDPDADPTEQSEALDHLLEVSSPISDLRASRDYRLAMLASLSRRALQLAAQRLRSARNGAAA